MAEKRSVTESVEENTPSIRALENEPDEDEQPGMTFFDGKITLGLFAEVIAAYVDISDEGDKNSGDLWDAYVSTIGLSMTIKPFRWMRGAFVAEIEDLYKDGGSTAKSLSEAFVTLEHPLVPVYLTVGKRTLPFGVFEDRMISGTLTEDLYEVVETGITVGATADRCGLDLSFTVYEGQKVIENLENFNTHEFESDRRKEDGFDAYIANLASEPVDDVLELNVFYNSEPGDGRRNESIGGAISIYFSDFVVDAEYITALERELGEDAELNLESAWFIALAYQPLTFLQVAARYEQFNDDRSGEQDEVVAYRCLGGSNLAVTAYADLSIEYRYTKFERSNDSDAAGELNEVQLQLAVEF